MFMLWNSGHYSNIMHNYSSFERIPHVSQVVPSIILKNYVMEALLCWRDNARYSKAAYHTHARSWSAQNNEYTKLCRRQHSMLPYRMHLLLGWALSSQRRLIRLSVAPTIKPYSKRNLVCFCRWYHDTFWNETEKSIGSFAIVRMKFVSSWTNV